MIIISSYILCNIIGHRENCLEICNYLESEFKKIFQNIGRHPENVEQLVELDEYINGLTNTMTSLSGVIKVS